ncbi:MAG: hypothetical protein J6Q69_04390 [Clostridia bacterium]|nr:hypothetical protein [Clostridia bacterium]
MQANQHPIKRVMPAFTAISIIEYLIFHTLYLSFSGINTIVIMPFICSISYFPALAVASHTSLGKDTKVAFIHTLIMCIPRFIVLIPFFYIFLTHYITNNWVDALLYALPTAFVITVAYVILIMVGYGLARLVFKRRKLEFDALSYLPTKAFHLKNPAARAIFMYPLLVFLVELAFELSSTVSFFIEDGQNYGFYDIAWMVIFYIFILLVLVITQAFSVFLANRSIRADEE